MSADYRSQERTLYEDVSAFIPTDDGINAFLADRFPGKDLYIQVGMDFNWPINPENPSIILYKTYPKLYDSTRDDQIDLFMLVASKNKEKGNIPKGKVFIGLLDNADFAELIGKKVGGFLQDTFKAKIDLDITNLVEQLFPIFAHMLQFKITTPKDKRDPKFG